MRRAFGRVLAAASALTVALSTVTLAATAPPAQAAETDSAVTLKWAGGNGELQQYQPNRAHMVDNADGSGHWLDFEDLQVSVSQTKNLTDQVVTVSITGMAPTDEVFGQIRNFVQLMQCWGPDPLADDFMQTCQYGALGNNADLAASSGYATNLGLDRGYVLNRGLQSSVADNGLRRQGEPFRTVFNQINQPALGYLNQVQNGLTDFVSPAATNEIPVVRILGTGSTSVQFEVQSAASQPYLGCGGAAGERCWLVAVPRGAHSGTLQGSEMRCGDPSVPPSYGSNGFGETGGGQLGSPLDRNCSFWQNRMVVPLDFQPTGAACPPGTAERRIVGTELAAGAMSSWQGALCTGADATVFSLTTNPGSTNRQHIATGQAGLGLTLQPITADDFESEGEEILQNTRLRYAPVMNTAITLAFIAERGRTRHTEIRLTPRLVAKLLTMSYRYQIPYVNGSATTYDEHVAGNPRTLAEDPEFRSLNGDGLGTADMGVIAIGPQGEDAVRDLWAYLQADDDARAFLQGQPDENDMRINPYFLPTGHPDALGGGVPYDLSKDPIDVLPKADQTLAPDQATADARYKGTRIDALMMAPYAGSFEHVTQRIFRGERGRQNGWDERSPNSAGEFGRWCCPGAREYSHVGGKYLMGPTDYHSALRYGLSLAALQPPNSDAFVAPTPESIAAGITGSVDDTLAVLRPADPSAVPSGGYPLVTTVYAAADVDSASLDDAARNQYAHFLQYAADAGQVQGELRGQLPAGYVPLTDAQRAQTRALAALIRESGTREEEDVPPGAEEPGGGTAVAANPPGSAATATTDATSTVDSVPTTQVTAESDVETTGALAGSAGLGGALIAGLAGCAAAPFLLRRRNVV